MAARRRQRKKRNPFRGIRTVIVSRRGGGSATSNTGAAGDYTFYAAAVPGGKGVLEIKVIGGVQQVPVIAAPLSVEPFEYTSGPAPLLISGFGWNAGGLVLAPFARLVGEESFEGYDVANDVDEADLTAGDGWDGGAALAEPYAHVVGHEDFESYVDGGVTGAVLTAGSGWDGAAEIFNY